MKILGDQCASTQTLTKREIKDLCKSITEQQPDSDVPFYLIDLNDVQEKIAKWNRNLPQVQPFFAVKCNPDPNVLKIMVENGCGFDVASKKELDQVLKYDINKENIVFANPCKPNSHIKFAAANQVNMMTFDNVNELKKIKKLHPTAQVILRIATDDSDSICQFSQKFGAARSDWLNLIATCRELNLELVGVSFHVGSGCRDVSQYSNSIQDVPRTNPSIELYQQPKIQELMERVLFIWAIRHPASGYVQGLNDLICPFMMVFFSEHVRHGEKFENIDITEVAEEAFKQVEADCFWCLGWLLDGIQDNYTFAQPGIQRQVAQLDDLIARIQPDLHEHLLEQGVQFLQFSFRWFNNLLMRELPLRSIVRLWDSYFAENGPDERSSLHLFVCSAFLIHWKRLLLEQCDFQGLMLTVQGLPTSGWGDSEIAELLAKAFMLRSTYTIKEIDGN